MIVIYAASRGKASFCVSNQRLKLESQKLGDLFQEQREKVNSMPGFSAVRKRTWLLLQVMQNWLLVSNFCVSFLYSTRAWIVQLFSWLGYKPTCKNRIYALKKQNSNFRGQPRKGTFYASNQIGQLTDEPREASRPIERRDAEDVIWRAVNSHFPAGF